MKVYSRQFLAKNILIMWHIPQPIYVGAYIFLLFHDIQTLETTVHFCGCKMASLDVKEQLKEVTLQGVKLIGQNLGQGAYGKVFTVKHLGLVCAAKEIHPLLLSGVPPEDKKAIKDAFIKECIRCNAIRHPNIVQFLGVYYSSAQSELPNMVMELLDTSLNSFVEKNRGSISLKTKFSILHDVSLGLCHLHGRASPVIHRDLSSNNILLTSHLVAKISDLGMAKMIRADSKQTKSR